MREENRRKREAEIAEATYRLLDQRGAAGVSMLAVAKAAKASNETMYRWYGDKQGLFLALVRANAAEARAALDHDPGQGSALEALARFGPKLLELVTGPKAIALNRAAAGDVSGGLGQAIAAGGRDSIAPLVARTLERAQDEGHIRLPDLSAGVATYFNLLIGDLQIRRVIGVLDPLSATDRQARSEAALAAFVRLFAQP